MSLNQDRSINTVGELKQAVQGLPDDTKLSMSATGDAGLSFRQDADRVIFGASQQQGQTDAKSST